MFKAYMKEYRRVAQAGLLNISHQIMIGTAIFMFLFGKYIGVELEILIFILTPIGFMLDFDANKYVINYSMPINIKRRLHMLHYLTIANSFIAVTMVSLRYYLGGQSRSLVITLFVFMLDIIGSNLYYYLFCSQEFKKDVLDEDKKQLIYQCIVGALIGIGIAGRLKWGVQSLLQHIILNIGIVAQILLLSGLFIFMIWWTSISMKRLEMVVRVEQEELK